jgi:hypothetical protein
MQKQPTKCQHGRPTATRDWQENRIHLDWQSAARNLEKQQLHLALHGVRA